MVAFKQKIRRIGNSRVIIIPAMLAKDEDINVGDFCMVTIAKEADPNAQ